MTENVKKAIREMKKHKKELENTYMKDIIESSTEKHVISFDSKLHSELLRELTRIGHLVFSRFSKKPITRQLFEQMRGKKVNAFRNNEVGDYCEIMIKKIFDENRKAFKKICGVDRLGGKGYPDLKIKAGNLTTFLEIKATSRPYEGSARDFFYSLGSASDKKISSDGLHLLLGFITHQVSDGFLIKGFKVVDVSKIKVRLKPEFNTDNPNIYTKEAVIYDKN